MQPAEHDAPPEPIMTQQSEKGDATQSNDFQAHLQRKKELQDQAISNMKSGGFTDKNIAENILVDQAVPEGSKTADKIRQQNSFKVVIIELICFGLFAIASISHTVLGHTQHDLFETTQAIQNELNGLPKAFSSLREFNDLWDWIGAFQRRSIVKVHSSTGSPYLRLGETPTIVLSDFRLTQRRVKLIQSEEQPQFQKWITNDFNSGSDFDEDIEDTQEFKIGPNQYLLHSIDDSYQGKGGFVSFLNLDQEIPLSDNTRIFGCDWGQLKFLIEDEDYFEDEPQTDELICNNYRNATWFQDQLSEFEQNLLDRLKAAQEAQGNMDPLNQVDAFQDQLEYFKNESEYQAMGTVSVIGDLLIFNHLSHTFAFIIIRIERTPAGMLSFSVDHVRPIGQRYPGKLITRYFEWIEWFEIAMSIIYMIKEISVLTMLIIAYQKEKKAAHIPQSTSEEVPRKELILRGNSNYASHGLQKKTSSLDRAYLQKFYKDETTNKEVQDMNPSLWLGIKNMIKSEQRILLYSTAVLIIPLTITHQKWHSIQDEAGINLATFADMINPNSDIVAKTRNGELNNILLELENLESYQQVGLTLFTMCIIVRVFSLLSTLMQRLNLYERTIKEVLKFLSMYIFVIFFVLFAFAMFCHIYYGSQLESFSTLPNSLISIALLALKDTKDLLAMEQFSPNIALTFYMVFVLVVLYFLMDIFIALVQFKYSQSYEETKEKKQTTEQILNERHWTYLLLTYFHDARVYCQRRQQNIADNAKLATAKAVTEQKKFQKNIQMNMKGGGDNDESKMSNDNASVSMSHKSHKSENESSSSNSDASSSSSGSSNSGSSSGSGSSSSSKNSSESDGEEGKDKGKSTGEKNSTADQKKKENSADHRALLEKLNWAVEFAPYDLDADFNENFVHTSTKEDYFVLKQREQRCGKVIWQTVMQLIYTILYLSMLISRFEVSNTFHQNKDLEDIILSHRVQRPLLREDDEPYFSSVKELLSINEIALWFDSFQEDFHMRTITVIDAISLDASTYDLYYLMNDKNYIMFQGITICAQLLDYNVNIDQEASGNYEQYTVKTDTVWDYENEKSYDYDVEAMDGIGGYCFGIHLEESEESFSQTIVRSLELLGLDLFNRDHQQVGAIQFHFITAEASSKMASNIEILFKQSEMSIVETNIEINTFKLNYYIQENLTKIVIDALFIILMLLNLYMFLNGEFNTMQRFKKWHEIKIEPLTSIEKKQRHMQSPQFVRKLQVIFRMANILFALHIGITIYNEFMWFKVVTDLSAITVNIDKFPSQFVTQHLTNLIDVNVRETSQLEMHSRIATKVHQFENYRRLAALNLLLILSLTFKNAAQSKQMRFFLNAMYGTLFASLYFAVILVFSFIGFFFYALHSFGYSSSEFKDLSYTSMTVFKMFVGRQLGEYYREVRDIHFYKALIFILPFMLMNFLFHTIFLAIVCQQYETEVLNADASSDIDLLSALFFCNISLDRRQKNRRAKAQQENETQMAANNEDNQQAVAGQQTGSKIGSWVIKDDGRLLEDGLNVFEKLEVNFSCSRNISKWAMGCGDEIKQEMVNRNKLKTEAQLLAKRLFMHRSGNKVALLALRKSKGDIKAHVSERIESFNLMCARIRFITYVWHGIQYFYMQSELLDAVIAYNEKVVKENTRQYKECNEQTEKMYEYLLLLEEPVAEKVEEQRQLKAKVKLLSQEMDLLNAFRSTEAIKDIVRN